MQNRNRSIRAESQGRNPVIRFRGHLAIASWTVGVLFGSQAPLLASPEGTLSLHPANPHYFLWRNQPTVLITSGEHYGAVLNLDFDYGKYLKTLAVDRLNLTRTFAGGTYFEPQGAFNIADNTLAPAPGRFIGPWARSTEPGFVGGGNKFDLNRWNDGYFLRLRDFVRQASELGVVVEMNLFCPFYEESQWKLSPFHPDNNVNRVPKVSRTNVYTLDQHGGLLVYQEKMVRKIVSELAEFDNVYYEICNEPYFGGVTLEWQRHVAQTIKDAQKDDPHPKLISQNVANKSAKVTDPDPNVSILNFHYATPPEAVAMNYSLKRALGDNETGFRGTNNTPYRTEAWEFIIAGGSLYNNLDYSFTVGHEDGTFAYPASQPGGGNPTFRKQMKALRDFMAKLEFVRMQPDRGTIQTVQPTSLNCTILSETGRSYAIYLRRADKDAGLAKLALGLPAGNYRAEWLNPVTGAIIREEQLHSAGSAIDIQSPAFQEDLAVSIRAATP